MTDCTELAEQQTRDWVKESVIGLNLCPFAAPVFDSDLIRYAANESQDVADLFRWTLEELDLFQRAGEEKIATSLLIYPKALESLDAFLGFCDELFDVFAETGLSEIIQAVPFHPDYLHEGYEEEDVSHFTNRSPYPTIHLLHFAQIQRLQGSYPDLDLIPQRNSERLQSLGAEELRRLWSSFKPNSS